MGQINFSFDNAAMAGILAQLDAVGELGYVAPQALQAGAEVLMPIMREKAPERSGTLKGSIKIGRRNGSSIAVGSFHGDAPHAHLVERGHGGPKPAPPHPFMEPAVQETEDQVIDAIMEELTKRL